MRCPSPIANFIAFVDYIRFRLKPASGMGKWRLSRIYIVARIKSVFSEESMMNQYTSLIPSPQNSLDIFKDEWASKLPAPLSGYKAGTALLFDDGRIKWLLNETGPLANKKILELGPLEGGHTYMLEHLGEATQIISIEANTRAYMKCLIVKELLDLKHAHFLCGDFIEFLRHDGQTFDVCVASGVLYHMRNPAELIELLSARCSGHLFLWTHYYDHNVISKSRALSRKYSGGQKIDYKGFQHVLYRQNYRASLGFPGFCGGNAPYSNWMGRENLFECLKFFGFGKFRINYDEPNHVNGPAIAVIAERI